MTYRFLSLSFIFLGSVYSSLAQLKPAISPGGVVSAADYSTSLVVFYSIPGPFPAPGMAVDSIATIFGSNLASVTQTANTVPLPTQLAGTTVMVSGAAAPLYFVSPGQINFQVPDPAASGALPMVITVSTAAGTSDPYTTLYGASSNFGIFTQDGGGCGPGAIQNVAADGSVSLNTRSNSVARGSYVSLYGTGLGAVYNSPPTGSPTPATPPATTREGAGPVLAFETANIPAWAGRAPGLVGVDQLNFQVPSTAREGCAVPVQIVVGGGGYSQPVTMSIRDAGGACVDPPSHGYGTVTWQKTITTDLNSVATESDTVSASLQASPGQNMPPLPSYSEGGGAGAAIGFGPSCAIPGYRSLSAGNVLIGGPAFSGLSTALVPLTAGYVAGLSVYQAILPSGSINSGSYVVSAAGGIDVGAFQSSLNIGSDIQISTALAGKTFFLGTTPLKINWTGGDPDTWVTVTLLNHFGGYNTTQSYQARATDGTISIGGFMPLGGLSDPNGEVIIEVTPDPLAIATFSAPGLDLGGRHSWSYKHVFQNVLLN